ncbi:hypothetical protein ANCDUO_11144 [Ancylostoma duodenale]|uniref:Uncharacterized protein n=1 Tax=Ancylostoma duodenale TaxID=51022 RepID=A0A0C2D8Z4_9BILA|nr:hypothetical protein ANCDUO_11144 [Ancylostoma duodenale]
MLNKPVALFVDVVDNGIIREADKRRKEILADDGFGAPLSRATKIVKTGIHPHLLSRERLVPAVSCSNRSMFMTKFVVTRTPTLPTHLMSQWLVPSRFAQSDDVVPDIPGLHYQILDGSLR